MRPTGLTDQQRAAPFDYAAIHPDPETAREAVIDTLLGALEEARGGLLRALDYRAATPEALAIKADVRHALERAAEALAWRGPGVERWSSKTGATGLALTNGIAIIAAPVNDPDTLRGLGKTPIVEP